MIIYKTNEEIALIRESCLILSKALGEVAPMIKPGARTVELDKRAEEFIRDHGGTPAFKGHNGFPYTLCVSPNDQVVHGFPSTKELKEGDIVSVDCGVNLDGYISDSAYTFTVGEVDEMVLNLLAVTKECLQKGIEQAVAGRRTGDIGYAVQEHAHQHKYGVVKELIGHGVGKMIHEEPEIPNYGRRGTGVKLREGMVIAVEPMLNMGSANVKFWDDGWTVSTRDQLPSAHYEHTVAVRKSEAEVLTTFEYIEKTLIDN